MSKKDNEMAPHFRKAVAEMDEDIQELQQDIERLRSMRAGIVELYGGDTDLPEPGVQTPRHAKRPATETVRHGREPSADAVKLLAAVRTAPEPFTAEALHAATALDAKLIANYLFRWKAKGWIQKTGRGEYQRLAALPTA